MKPEASKEYQIHRNSKHRQPGYRAERNMRSSGGAPLLEEISLTMILQQLWRGICKLLVALRFLLHRATGGRQLSWRLPWFKLGLAALALFILTQKDIQFSVNMKAPLGDVFSSSTSSDGAAAVPTTQQLSILQPLSKTETVTVSRRVPAAEELDVAAAREYIKRFRKVAIVEMRKFGIPASIKMGQGLLESMAGQSTAALSKDNHFGPAFDNTHFDSAWENWRAHSLFLQREFQTLLTEGTHYKAWARGLRKMGYSSDPEYDQKLIDVIQRYQLYLLDEEGI